MLPRPVTRRRERLPFGFRPSSCLPHHHSTRGARCQVSGEAVPGLSARRPVCRRPLGAWWQLC